MHFVFRTTILSLLLFPFSLRVKSQNITGPLADKQFSVGLQVGYNESTLHGSRIDFELSNNYSGLPTELKTKHFPEIDFSFNRRIFKFIYLKTGLGYTNQGGKLEHTSDRYPVDVRLSYVTIPLGLGINPILYRRISMAAEAGFQIGIETSSEQDFKKGFAPFVQLKSNTVIPGYFLGGSLLYSINPRWSIQVSYRYANSLKPFFEMNYHYNNYIVDEDMYSKAKSFSAGIIYTVEYLK